MIKSSKERRIQHGSQPGRAEGARALPVHHYTTPYAILSIGKLYKDLREKYPEIGQNFFQNLLTFPEIVIYYNQEVTETHQNVKLT